MHLPGKIPRKLDNSILILIFKNITQAVAETRTIGERDIPCLRAKNTYLQKIITAIKATKLPKHPMMKCISDALETNPADEPLAGQDITLSGREELVGQIEKLEKENNELSDRLLRTMAEFDNYRKRVAREKDDLLKYGAEKMALDILPVADNFERALEQAKTAANAAAVVEGVEMIFKQFLATLEKFNIKPFDSIGQTFDPEKHEAMAHQEQRGVC